MSLLRVYCPLQEQPPQCRWISISDTGKTINGEGSIFQLPRDTKRVQVIIPAQDVFITHCQLPDGANRRTGKLFSFAIEDKIATDPESNQVSVLGSLGNSDFLAVVDQKKLTTWLDAFARIGAYEVYCETLLLPLATKEWSIAWDGREGFIRTGKFEGGATDQGNRTFPPLSILLMLDEAEKRGVRPTTIAFYVTKEGAEPDLKAWQNKLGVTLRINGLWDWTMASENAGAMMMRESRNWHSSSVTVMSRLRFAACVASAALAIHSVALFVDWAMLAGKQRALLQQMETRFRNVFPDTSTVVDPALQMRRKLTEVRHAGGLADSGDFLPMTEKVAASLKEVGPISLRTISYESGRLTIEIPAIEEGILQRLKILLVQSGLNVDIPPPSARTESKTIVMTVRTL